MKSFVKPASYLLLMFALYVVFISSAGYFGIGHLSDDHLNIISASSSSLGEKLTGKVPFYSPHHYRPAWFVAIQFTQGLSDLMGQGRESAFVSRAVNLILFFLLATLAALLVFRISGSVIRSISAAAIILLYPNNVNSICWTIGMVDLMCGSLILGCLIYSRSYADSVNKASAMLSAVCLALALLTKETAVTTALICYLFLLWTMPGKKKQRAFIFVLQMIVTMAYIVFRLTVTGSGPAGMMTAYSLSGAGRAVVLVQAVLSAILPFDYLTIQHAIASLTPVALITILLMIMLVLMIFLTLFRNGGAGVMAKCSALFLITIAPNMFAGYFRPQLILIPFALTLTLLLVLLSGKISARRAFLLPALSLIMLWILISFNVVSQWKDASDISRRSYAILGEIPADEISDAVILGLPGRLGQAHVSEYITGTYNYLNPPNDGKTLSISDAVHTSALDEVSLDSEIRQRVMSGNAIELSATGKTQYFQITGSRQDSITVNGVNIKLHGQNDFRKPTKVTLEISGTQTPVYLLNSGKLSRLEF